jgi:hypothetical protein
MPPCLAQQCFFKKTKYSQEVNLGKLLKRRVIWEIRKLRRQ